ncbi:NfeD family protein [Paracoccus sp. (in: a-proteobacteria)]|uniref:NfeD family protein n=1 Tax=Paracoccus sp. TaxID=267 RepID=UPI003A890B13
MMNGWIWIVMALLLAITELFAPGWVFLGIACAVGMMGLLLLTGWWTAGLPVTLVVTAILSGAIWLAMRRLGGVRKGQVRIWDRDINE